jgi:thiol-disulfide isomerase/thioredoxin
MKIKRTYLILFSLVVLGGVVLFSPLKFYTFKYANRFLSYNTTPVEEREQAVLTAQDWRLTGREGAVFNLAEHREEVLVINFWATWCPPCIQEMPDLQRLYAEYGDKVTFVFVARDRADRVWPFLEKNGYRLPVYLENSLTPEILYHTSIPSTYIVDKKGVIRMAKNGAYDWYSDSIRELLDTLLKA